MASWTCPAYVGDASDSDDWVLGVEIIMAIVTLGACVVFAILVKSSPAGVLPRDFQLFLFSSCVAVDALHAAKHIANPGTTLVVRDSKNVCEGFGIVETFLTLLRGAAGCMYWTYFAGIVWKSPFIAHSRYFRVFTATFTVIVSVGLTLVAAFVPGTIGRQNPSTWCWVCNTGPRFVFGDLWFIGQGVLACLCIIPVWCRDLGYDAKVSLTTRFAVCIPYGLAVGGIYLAQAIVKSTEHRSSADRVNAYAAASLVPLEGLSDVVVFFLSEPQMFGLARSSVGLTLMNLRFTIPRPIVKPSSNVQDPSLLGGTTPSARMTNQTNLSSPLATNSRLDY